MTEQIFGAKKGKDFKKILLLLFIFVMFGLLIIPYTMAKIEEPQYDVLEKQGAIEVRLYRPYVVAETTVKGDFGQVGNEGFRRLFNYISGGNRSKQSIAMTAPVGQQPQGQKIAMTAPVGQQAWGDAYLVWFAMPSEFTFETLPEPNDERVTLRQVPEHRVAVIRYSGTWSQSRYNAHEKKLRDFIEKNGYQIKGEPLWARYDPPFMPFFLRRNEIQIEVEPMPTSDTNKDKKTDIYAFNVVSIGGTPVSLADYRGKAVLIVNTASKCGFTRQYEGLQALYERYKDKGFAVLGFPANNFGNQEPGSDAQIREFCSTRYQVTFPMFAKISVAGADIAPLYAYLTDTEANAPHGGPIQWNFTKFLIGKDGRTVARFGSRTEPLDKNLTEAIENIL